VLSNGSQADQELSGMLSRKPVQMQGVVIKATATEFDIAGSSETSTRRRRTYADFEDKVPCG